MQAFIDALKERQDALQRAISKAKSRLKNVPQGHLETATSKKQTYWYHVKDTNSGRKYIPRKNVDLAKALASKTYAEKFITRASRELRILEQYIKVLGGKTPETLYSELCRAKKELVQPIWITDDLSALLWESAPYEHGNSHPEHKIYPTKKGDLVRSKSEALIADMYLDMGIPYRYEQVLVFPDGSELDPDFTIWDKKNRQEIYHEHCGLIDDPGYRRRFLQKIDIYRRNGIYTGKNLILTFEGDGTTLNMAEMRIMINELFQ